ncbi:hypothetical protein COL922a_005137 [Colletotrichum nupharicola]|nr:hypothetical protein COL922a_005137 [Colletotrichum nupharicola]
MGFDTYATPLDGRYASPEMKTLFGARSRHSTWRKLWLFLAQAEKETGVEGITDEALKQMEEHLTVTDEDFQVAAVEEKRRRHDVMARYVTDNAELILMRDAMDLLLPKLAKVIDNLSKFALEHKDLPTLGYTHYQPAQLKFQARDLKNIETQRKELRFRGAMGTTGTQASFMEVYHGDGEKIDKLNERLCELAGFETGVYDISVQTYSRKVDLDVSNAIAGLGATAMHITNDLRHLATQKEIEE